MGKRHRRERAKKKTAILIERSRHIGHAGFCQRCGSALTAATPLRMIDDDDDQKSRAVPEPGNLSYCFYCGLIMVFDEHLQLHPITQEQKLWWQTYARAEWDVWSKLAGECHSRYLEQTAPWRMR